MKKVYTLALAAMMAAGVASAESLTVSFNRTGTDAASVTATTDVEGVTAALTAVSPAMKSTAGSVTSAILCPNVNGNTGANIDFALSVTGLPANAQIESIDLDIHALNGANGYQAHNDGPQRFYNVSLSLDGTAFASSEFDIAAGVNTDSDQRHKAWTFTPAAAATATSPLNLGINVTSKAATNEGCFFGLSNVVINYTVAAEPVQYALTFKVVDQKGANVVDAKVELYDNADFDGTPLGWSPAVYSDTYGEAGPIRFESTQTTFYYRATKGTWDVVTGTVDCTDAATKTVTVEMNNPDAVETTTDYALTFKVEDQTGAPVANASVALYESADTYIPINSTNYYTEATGLTSAIKFSSAKTEFSYYVNPSKAGWEAVKGTVDCSDATTKTVTVVVQNPDVVVTPSEYTVTFIVTDKETGKPMSGVEASIYNDKNEFLVGEETDEDGEAMVVISNPTQTTYAYSLYAGKEYDEEKGQLDFSKEPVQIVEVAMSGYAKVEGWTIQGTVLNEDRRPIETAVANYNGNIYRSVYGYFNFTVPKTENTVISVTYSATGYEDKVVDYDFSTQDVIMQDITLSVKKVLGEPFTATFTVTNDSEEPLEGATVTVDGQSADTDANGQATFTIDNDTAAETHVFAYTVVMSDYETATGKLDFDAATDGTIAETVVMQPVAVDPNWTDLGAVAYTDFMSGATWNVVAQKHNEQPRYRLVNPYTNGNQPASSFKVLDVTKTVYIEFDVTDPNAVTIDTGDKDYVALNVCQTATEFLGELYLQPVSGATGTYADGTITFAKDAVVNFYGMFGPSTSYPGNVDMVVVLDPQTGLGAIEAAAAEGAVIYDLQGRRVAHPAAHGIYIVNGKKVTL